MHELKDSEFPYELQWSLLIAQGWEGWCFVENSAKVPDRAQALIEQHRIWDEMIARAVARSGRRPSAIMSQTGHRRLQLTLE